MERLAHRLAREWKMNKWVYAIAIPVLAYYILFCYAPMYGAQIAFKNYTPGRGIWGSKWVGTLHFETFFNGIYFARTLRNTKAVLFICNGESQLRELHAILNQRLRADKAIQHPGFRLRQNQAPVRRTGMPGEQGRGQPLREQQRRQGLKMLLRQDLRGRH